MGATELRRHRYIAPQMKPERAGRQRRVEPLQQVAKAEGDAGHDQPDARAAQVLLEPREQERALHLFPHAAGHQRDDCKEPPIARRLQQARQRVVGDVVQPRRDVLRDQQHRRGNEQHRHHAQQPQRDLSACEARPQENIANRLAVCGQQRADQHQQQHGVGQRQQEHPGPIQRLALDKRAHAQQRKHLDQQQLRRDAGAGQHLHDRAKPHGRARRIDRRRGLFGDGYWFHVAIIVGRIRRFRQSPLQNPRNS